MISEETEERLKRMGIMYCDILGTGDADTTINIALDEIDKSVDLYRDLNLAYLKYSQKTRKLRIVGKDVSNRLTYEEFKEKWLNENS